MTFETCRRKQKLNINLENCAYRWFVLYNPICGADSNSVITNMATVRKLETRLILDRSDARTPAHARTSARARAVRTQANRNLKDVCRNKIKSQ
jgi:hypothetical protein